jgi:hypothetical protein
MTNLKTLTGRENNSKEWINWRNQFHLGIDFYEELKKVEIDWCM